MEQNGETWEGISENGFAAAAKNAVDKFEEDHPPPHDELVLLRVVEMYVTVDNPLHDYRVKLGQT
jgi:flavin-binding protein dodecin